MMAAGEWRLSVPIGTRPPPVIGRREPARDLQDVGVPAGGVEDEDLLAVVRALDDGQQVVLAPRQERGRYPDVVDGVVDAVEADADPTGHQEHQRQEAGPGADEDALEPAAVLDAARPWGTATPSCAVGIAIVKCPPVGRPGSRPALPRSSVPATYGPAIAPPLPLGFDVVAVASIAAAPPFAMLV